MKKIILLFIFFFIFPPTPSNGGIFDKLKQSINKDLNNNGDTITQYNEGIKFYQGMEVAIDYKEAMKWFLLAANQGYADAQNYIGIMYHNGEGVLQDYKEAVKWYRLAVEQGNPHAQNNLGIILLYGNGGIKPDYNEALKLFQLSANQGHDDAQEYIKIASKKILLEELKGDSLSFSDLFLDKEEYYGKEIRLFGKLSTYILSSDQTALIYDESNPNIQILILTDNLSREDRKFFLDCSNKDCYLSVIGTFYRQQNENYQEIYERVEAGEDVQTQDFITPIDIITIENYKEKNAKYANKIKAVKENIIMKEADHSSDKHVDCPSETDSLKRLTCYDNLLDNLKNKNCSSISDSLKRLSCFEIEKNSDVAEETNRDSLQSKQPNNDKEMDAEYEKSVEPNKNKNWSKVLEIIKPLATQGHAKSQTRLGVMYANGRGVPQDYKEAVKWYRLSAEQGDSSGQFNMGQVYEYGVGVTIDLKEAVKWYRLSAEQGDSSGQSKLGFLYQTGKVLGQDLKKAVKWNRLSAKQGFAKAQSNLGGMYRDGQGVPQDYKEAIRLYRLAAEQGYAPAQSNLGYMYANGQGAKVNFKEAIKWIKLAVKKGHPQAQKNLEIVENLEKTRRLKEGCGDKLCLEHIEIMQSFVNNLENGNIDKVVNSIIYPLTFFKSGKQIVTIDDKHMFENYYDYIFPKNIIKEMAADFSTDTHSNFIRNGRIMLGDGSIWFDVNTRKVYSINKYDEKLISKMSKLIDEETIFMTGEEDIQTMINRLGCPLCHTMPGIKGAVGNLGPLLTKQKIENSFKNPKYKGNTKNLREYVVESILKPNAYIVFNDEAHEPYPEGMMPTTYREMMSDKGLKKLVDYMMN